MLYEPLCVRSERGVDRGVVRLDAREALQRPRVTGVAQRRAGLVQPAPSEQRRGRRPRRAVAVGVVRPGLGAERDELGEIGDRVDGAGGGDEYEPVREQLVAEEERGVLVRWVEEPRAPVVEEVALVDRLEPEREARVGDEWREDRHRLARPVGAESVGP